ncbi:MAG: hypothetical protein HC854_04095, partial [Flavobacterium sp.]|nr:hypothetical protein [Flavobacterium sp.]
LNILFNLHQRFTKAGIKDYNYFVADVSKPGFEFPELGYKGLYTKDPVTNFDIIVCDVPCTGSGTWSRTPENLYYFKTAAINEFAARQQQIVCNAAASLKNGGLLFYITCSVFKKENEDVAQFIKEKFHLQLLHMELLNGYDKKADSMFVAVFTKSVSNGFSIRLTASSLSLIFTVTKYIPALNFSWAQYKFVRLPPAG